MYDFSTATVESGSDYITKPGFYLASVSEVTLNKPEDKTPSLSVVFETSGGRVTERFFISQKALGRLKTLFKGAWNDKDMNQTFKTPEEVADFFKIALTKKPVKLGLRVFLEEANNNRFYARLPFNDFVALDINKFEERVVEPNDPDYVNWILKARTPEPAKNDKTIIDQPASWESVANEKAEDDDLPF